MKCFDFIKPVIVVGAIMYICCVLVYIYPL